MHQNCCTRQSTVLLDTFWSAECIIGLMPSFEDSVLSTVIRCMQQVASTYCASLWHYCVWTPGMVCSKFRMIAESWCQNTANQSLTTIGGRTQNSIHRIPVRTTVTHNSFPYFSLFCSRLHNSSDFAALCYDDFHVARSWPDFLQ